MIRYEHPLNERIRTMMRLEDLFQRARYFSAKAEPNDHHAALNAMFEIAEIASRADLKSDLLQELERQRQLLSGLRENPQVAWGNLRRRRLIAFAASISNWRNGRSRPNSAVPMSPSMKPKVRSPGWRAGAGAMAAP